MRTPKDWSLDGQTWTVTLFGAGKGLDLWLEIQARLGPGIGHLIGNAAAALKEAGTSITLWDLARAAGGGLAPAIGDMCSRMGEPGMSDLVKRLLSGTLCDGKEVVPQFDVLFAGRYGVLARVLGFVVETNYDIPLGSLGLGAILAAPPTAPPSTSTSASAG